MSVDHGGEGQGRKANTSQNSNRIILPFLITLTPLRPRSKAFHKVEITRSPRFPLSLDTIIKKRSRSQDD
eukprot:766130-Hanusia_phi.AAC.1